MVMSLPQPNTYRKPLCLYCSHASKDQMGPRLLPLPCCNKGANPRIEGCAREVQVSGSLNFSSLLVVTRPLPHSVSGIYMWSTHVNPHQATNQICLPLSTGVVSEEAK